MYQSLDFKGFSEAKAQLLRTASSADPLIEALPEDHKDARLSPHVPSHLLVNAL